MNPQPGRRLDLFAYDGCAIPNSIDADPARGFVALTRGTDRNRLLIAAATQLGHPTGRYNCHGLVFASRRTNIPPAGGAIPVDIDNLLRSDQYEHVASPPRVGDIVVYRGTKEIEHTGFVCRIDRLGGADSSPIAWVWSMWGGLGEFEHPLRSCPYGDCTIEFWRLRR